MRNTISTIITTAGKLLASLAAAIQRGGEALRTGGSGEEK